jgi:hypothetical protein
LITIAMTTDLHATADIPMPRLSDDAVVQIHDFIAHFLDLFEARYGDQIHRYYDEWSSHNMVGPEPTPRIDDPPF